MIELSDKVTVKHIRYLCFFCEIEVLNLRNPCAGCGSKKYIPRIERDQKEEQEVEEIIRRLKLELNKNTI